MKSDLRERILDVATELFNQRGYGNVTLRDIAGSLGISVGNLNYHFRRKQDLLSAIMARNFLAVAREDEVKNLGQFRELLQRMLDSLLLYSFYFRDPSLASLNLLGEQNVDALQKMVTDALEALRGQGVIAPSLEGDKRESIVQFIMYSHLGWVQQSTSHMDEEVFLNAHWALLEPYLTEEGNAQLAEILS